MWKPTRRTFLTALAAMSVLEGYQPGDAAAQPPSERRSGEALAISVLPLKAEFNAAEYQGFELTLTNHSDQAIEISPDPRLVENWRVDVEEADSHMRWSGRFAAIVDRRGRQGPAKIEAGKSLSLRMGMSDFTLIPADASHTPPVGQCLREGRYSVTFSLPQSRLNDASRQGDVPAASVEFTVRGATPGSLVTKGLFVSLAPSPRVLAWDAPVTVYAQFKNLTNGPIALAPGPLAARWDVRFENDTGDVWRADLKPTEADAGLIRLEPGKDLNIAFQVGQLRWDGSKTNPNLTVKQLQPGNWKLSAVMHLPNRAVEDGAAAVWAGDVKIPPIGFQISPPPPKVP